MVQVNKQTVLYKLRAAAFSLAVFLLFATVLASVTYLKWYPDYLFWLDGGLQGLRLVFAVDFVLGPLLTLVFFHPEKTRSKLMFDVAVIACVQLSAMGWGAYQVYKERPIAVVYGEGRFISVAPAIMAMQSVSAQDLQAYSAARPPYVYRREPVTERERMRMIGIMFRHGIHPEAQAWLFTPFATNSTQVFAKSREISGYIAHEPDLAARLQQWLRHQPAQEQALDSFRLAFYEGRFANALLIFDAAGRYRSYISMGESALPGLMTTAVLSAEQR